MDANDRDKILSQTLNPNQRTRIQIHPNALQTEERVKAILASYRRSVPIGRSVTYRNDGSMDIGNIIEHRPSPYLEQCESIYYKGPPGAGKTYACYGFAAQTFLGEGRTWILLDTKGSFLGNNRPNMKYEKSLHEFNLFPVGIPGLQMDVIAPQYYVEMQTPQDIERTWVTDYYKVPLRFCGVKQMFEMTKANRKAQYASTLDESFRDLLIRTNNSPRLTDVYDMIQEIVDDPDMKRLEWVYRVMLLKLQRMSRWTIEEGVEWSSVGNALFKAVLQSQKAGRIVPRWIVFTLSHAEHPEEDMNLALVSAVLTEIYAFAKYARLHGLPIHLGIMMDELHTYVRNKEASAREAIHDLLFAWGRSNEVVRCLLSLHPKEKIWCVDKYNTLQRIEIGKLIDTVLNKFPTKVKYEYDKMYEAIYEPIDDWRIFTRNPKTMKLEIRPISAFIRHDNIDQLYKVILNDGREVTVTGCHSIFTLNQKTLYPEAIAVKDLKIGDWIEFSLELPFENPIKSLNLVQTFLDHDINLDTIRVRGVEYIQYLWDHYYNELRNQFDSYTNFFSTKRKGGQIALKYLKALPKQAYSDQILIQYNATLSNKPPAQPIPCIVPLNNDFWWLMGLITGDGAVTNNSTIAISCEYSYLVKARSIWKKIFNIEHFSLDIDKRLHPSRGKQELSGELWVSNQVVWRLIHDILCIQSPAIDKSAPDILFSQSTENIESYLQGLWDAEGFKQRSDWSISSISKTLIHDVMQLWGKLGKRCSIAKSIRQNAHEIYTITILQKCQQSTLNKFPLSYDMITTISQSEKITNDPFIKTLKYRAKYGYNITEYSATKLAEMCNCDEYTNRYKQLISGTSRFAQIKEIIKIYENTKVYDISVDGFENFISADQIICHNTQKDDQLDKLFRDDVSNLQDKGSYTYSEIVACEAIPNPGHALLVNRLQPNSKSPDLPFIIPKLKLAPPLCEVESKQPDTEAWLEDMTRKREEQRRSQHRYYEEFDIDEDPFRFNPDSDLRCF